MFSKNIYNLLKIATLFTLIIALVVGLAVSWRYSLFILALSNLLVLPTIWWKNYLSVVPVTGQDLNSRLSKDVLSLLDPKQPLSSKSLWDQLKSDWQAEFICHHLLLTNSLIDSEVSLEGADQLNNALQYATQIADMNGVKAIEVGFIIAGILKQSSKLHELLLQIKAVPEDIDMVAHWLARKLAEEEARKNIYSGGIGRDWSFGFTPLLDKFGSNISLAIEKHGAHFGWLTNSVGVTSTEKAFDNHASAVALIGQVGIGKSNTVYALAQKLIEGKTSDSLAYHQIISINATDIVSVARGQGDLENIMISLANEASHAGHVILFFDDAELFFSSGPGSFDASQILLSIIQHRAAPIIFALSPNDYEKLKASSGSLASLISPIVLQELDRNGVMRVLEDAAIRLENQNNILVSYDALKAAYNLSGRYNNDVAYPGKAIKLLEQSVNHANQGVLSYHSVEQAMEQISGIRVASAAPAEASELLNLEAKIHERMINQDRAVSVIANSLRRARAGVTNPNRPIGSFLFLGPTGVGKTELAKSLAAIYFKSESSMIRLDMSEYQNPEDIGRLLGNDNSSLIMAVRQKPFSVVLLDEIEKAHPNILNLLLQLLDEGQLTDSSNRRVSFKDAIIIATSNASAQSIRERVQKGEDITAFESDIIEEIISSNTFKPELINRFDEIVLFRPLKPDELAKVVNLMLKEINHTLSNQNISVSLSEAAVNKIVSVGNDPRLGARPMRRTLQKAVEDTVAKLILEGKAKAGDHISLDEKDLLI
jgi:ATP-dependent Clp protease ATP-binding subunit ClpC